MSLKDEHGVAEGEEAVVILFGGFVGMEHVFAASEGTHHHEEGGFGEVEVGDDGIDDAPLVAGVDKEVGIRVEGCDWSPCTDVANGFWMGRITSGAEDG